MCPPPRPTNVFDDPDSRVPLDADPDFDDHDSEESDWEQSQLPRHQTRRTATRGRPVRGRRPTPARVVIPLPAHAESAVRNDPIPVRSHRSTSAGARGSARGRARGNRAFGSLRNRDIGRQGRAGRRFVIPESEVDDDGDEDEDEEDDGSDENEDDDGSNEDEDEEGNDDDDVFGNSSETLEERSSETLATPRRSTALWAPSSESMGYYETVSGPFTRARGPPPVIPQEEIGWPSDFRSEMQRRIMPYRGPQGLSTREQQDDWALMSLDPDHPLIVELRRRALERPTHYDEHYWRNLRNEIVSRGPGH